MRYTYDVTDTKGTVIEAGFANREEAYEYCLVKELVDYTIVERQHYTVKGLGRDPDLH
jgi:hypothetical protein